MDRKTLSWSDVEVQCLIDLVVKEDISLRESKHRIITRKFPQWSSSEDLQHKCHDPVRVIRTFLVILEDKNIDMYTIKKKKKVS